MELPAANVQTLGRDWRKLADAVIKCITRIRTAPRHSRSRYAKLLSAKLTRDFNEQLSPDDWSAAASAHVPQILLSTALALCGCAPKEEYWQITLQAVQVWKIRLAFGTSCLPVESAARLFPVLMLDA